MKKTSIISLIVVVVLLACQFVLAATVTLTGSTQTVACANNAYIVQNNIWGASTAQSIQVDTSTGNFSVTVSNHNLTGGAPASYPSVYKGSHWGLATSNSGMPIQVGSISSCNSSWNISMGSGTYDCAYDVWFNTTPTTSGQPNGAELMIWINRQGSVQPAGSIVGTVNIAGATWNVWFSQLSWKYIAYDRVGGTTSVNFDINAFIKDCVSRGYIQNNWYMIDVEAGFELWKGGVGCASNNFSVTVNGGGGNPTPPPSGSYKRIRNVATGLYIDGMGSTGNGSNACQWSSSGSNNQQWTIINSGGYVMIQNRATGLYLDGMGRTSNGSICGQWTGSGSSNQQWTQETSGSYVRFRNRATGLYLDGMGSTGNGSNLCQWTNGSSTNQQWQIQ